MVKYFLSTHGRLASGFKNAAEVLLGSIDNLTVFDAYVDENSVGGALDSFFKSISASDTIILLADIVGGSVCNTMIPYSLRPNTYLIGGINLATLLELLILEEISDSDLEEIIDIGKSGVQLIKILEDERSTDDSDDFF